MLKFKAEKGVPIPKRSGGATQIYPWDTMEIDESFFVPMPGGKAHPSVAGAGRRYGRKFTARVLTEGGVKGARIWRTA